MTAAIGEIGAIAGIEGRIEQGVEVGADRVEVRANDIEAVHDGPTGGNSAEGRDARGRVMAEVVEEIRTIAEIERSKGEGIEVEADADPVRGGATGGNGAED